MKRIIGLVLVFCLVFSLAAEAVAAPKWEITEQTKIEVNEKKKTLTISVKVKAKSRVNYQWVFTNPEDPNDTTTGKKIVKDSRFKGIKITSPTKSKITLSKIPEALNGWTVHCHLYSNAYTLDTDPVVITVPGMEPPAPPEEKPAADDGEGGDEGETAAPAPAEETKSEDAKAEKPAAGDEGEGESEDEGSAPEYKDFTVSANGKYLFKVDSKGNPEGDEGVSSLTFTGSGNVAVKSEQPFTSWTVNGVRFEPADEVTGFKMFNLSADTSISLKTAVKTAASANVDESTLFTITCKGCSFTYAPKGLKSAKEGQVPSGAVIYVFADSTDAAANGYSINGGEAQNPGAMSMQITVTEDMEIVAK